MAREPPPPQSLERLLTEAEEAPLFLAGPEAPNAHAVFNGPHAAAEALAAAVRHLEDGARAALVAAADAHGAALLTLRPASDVAPADTIAVLRAVETDTQTLLEQTLPTLGLLDTSLEPGHHDASAPLPTCALHASDTAGHGMAAILRVVLALREKVLPADAGTAAPPFYRLAEPAPWIHGAPHPRRALALFPGLGLLFEEAGGATTSVVAEWPSELVLLSAPTVPDLQRRIVDLRRRLDNDEATLLADLSFTLSTLPPERHRAAILARSVPELKTRLDALAGKLSETATKSSFKTRTGLYYADTAAAPRGKTLWMFPGQGAQYLGMAAEAARCLPSVRDWLDAFAARLDPLGELPATRLLQQPTSDAIKSALLPTLHSLEGGGQVSYVTMLALHDVLDAMAIPCDGMVGYSNGENAALVASGAMRLTREGVLRIMAMLKTQTLDPEVAARMPKGVMLAVSLTTHSILDLVADELSGPDPVYVALDNCPHQLVLFGDEKRIAQVEERLTAVGAMCFRLPFDRAYHTPLFERFLPLLRLAYEGIDLGPGRVPVYSCSTMEPFPDDAPSIFEVAIGQWAQTVRFRETVEKLHARGFRAFVEVGTGGKLLGFVRDTLRDQHDVTGAATTLEGRSDIWTLQELAAQFFIQGTDVRLAPFFEHRPVRAVALEDPAAQRGLYTPAAQRGLEDLATLPRPSRTLPRRGPHDPARARLVNAHFSLMQDFLEGQAALYHDLFGNGRQPVQPAPAPAQPATTPPPAAPSATPYPMLGTRLERHPKELRCTRTLTRTSDPFLLDHTLGRRIAPVRPAQIGLPVVPFTFSMELACEAASHLLDTPSVVTEVRDVRGYRWLALDQDELTLEVRAVLTGTDANGATVSTRIFDRGWGPASPRHLGLEQTVCLAPRWPAPPSPLDVQLDPPLEARWTVEKFYEICLFHGPCLQVLNKLRTVSQRGIEAELLIPSTAGLFENTPHPRLEIPAPMLDAAMQLAAYWVVEQDHEYFGVFPFNIGRYRQFAAPPEPGARLVCRGSLRLDGSVVIGDFDYLDGGGRVIARLEDVRLRYFEFPREFLFSLYWQDLDQSYSTKHAARMPAQRWDFLADGGGIWLRALAHITLTPKECKRWYALPEQGSERKRWLMERMVSKNAVRDWVKDAKGVKLHSVDIELVENPGGTLQPVAEQVPSIPAVALTLHDGNFVAVLENQMEVE